MIYIGVLVAYKLIAYEIRCKFQTQSDIRLSVIVEDNVTENAQLVLLHNASEVLWTLEYPNPQHLTTEGSSNSSLSDIDATRAAGSRALAVTWARQSRIVLTSRAPERLFDTVAEVEHHLLGI